MHQDFDSLSTIIYASKKDRWSYPKTFQALVDAGVASYEVKLDKYQAEYRGNFGSWFEPAPEGLSNLTINTEFDKNAFINGLKDHIAGKTTYVQWLAHSAKAGVARYVVNMADRTVTYYGINSNDFHVEHVPQIS